MTKKERILETALSTIELLGEITTFDLKEELRAEYPEEIWNQKYVSAIMRDNYEEHGLDFSDNGIYRTYFLNSGNTPEKIYSLKFEENTISGNFDFVSDVISSANLPCRYSNSKDEFILFEDMHPYYIINVVKKEVRNASTLTELVKVMSTGLAKWVTEKHS